MFIMCFLFVVTFCVDQKRLNVMYIVVSVVSDFEQDLFFKMFESISLKRYVYNGFGVCSRSTATKRFVYNGLEHFWNIESCHFEGLKTSKRYVYNGFGAF